VFLPVVMSCDVSAECLPWFKGIQCLRNDLGAECSSNPAELSKVTIKAGSNDLVLVHGGLDAVG
jgi:hypothetical protein